MRLIYGLLKNGKNPFEKVLVGGEVLRLSNLNLPNSHFADMSAFDSSPTLEDMPDKSNNCLMGNPYCKLKIYA
jgi:hypothetical protein